MSDAAYAARCEKSQRIRRALAKMAEEAGQHLIVHSVYVSPSGMVTMKLVMPEEDMEDLLESVED